MAKYMHILHYKNNMISSYIPLVSNDQSYTIFKPYTATHYGKVFFMFKTFQLSNNKKLLFKKKKKKLSPGCHSAPWHNIDPR